MDRHLISFSSENKKTGPIMVTSSTRSTCPTTCKWNKLADPKRPACYAGKGFFGQFMWRGLERNPVGTTFGNGVRVYSFEQLLIVVRMLVEGPIWRHNQACDLQTEHDGITIDRDKLRRLVEANRGRHCFTFTHHDVIGNASNREAVKEACAAGFMINLSADSLEEADALADLNIAPCQRGRASRSDGEHDDAQGANGRDMPGSPRRRGDVRIVPDLHQAPQGDHRLSATVGEGNAATTL